MRGRKSRPLRSFPMMLPSCRRSLGAARSPGTRSNGPGRSRGRCRGTNPTLSRPDSTRSFDRLEDLPPLRELGPDRAAGSPAPLRAPRADFPPSSGPRSSPWPALSRSPGACTSPTGPVRIWPARRSTTGSSRPSAPERSADPGRRRSPTAPDPLLADRPARRPVQERAEKVLWCYANAERLARGGIGRLHRRDAQQPGARTPADPSGDPRLDRAAGVRVHPARDGQHPAFLVVHTGRMEAACLGANTAEQYIPALAIPAGAPQAAGRVPDPRRRAEPHRRGDGGLSRRVRRLVATPVDAGPRLLAEPGGVAQPRLRTVT